MSANAKTLAGAVADDFRTPADGHADEGVCDLCKTVVGIETLSHVECFPLVKVCEGCLSDLDDESADSRADDPGCSQCAGGCNACLGISSPTGAW